MSDFADREPTARYTTINALRSIFTGLACYLTFQAEQYTPGWILATLLVLSLIWLVLSIAWIDAETQSGYLSFLPTFFCSYFHSLLHYFLLSFFLGATKRLYKRVCPSVHPSVHPSVGPSVRPSVTPSDLPSYRGVSEHLMPCIRPCFDDRVHLALH